MVCSLMVTALFLCTNHRHNDCVLDRLGAFGVDETTVSDILNLKGNKQAFKIDFEMPPKISECTFFDK